MELSHKRARIELEKAANTNARNYEVSGMSAHGLGALACARTHGEHLQQWFGLVQGCALVCSGLSQNVYSYSFFWGETKLKGALQEQAWCSSPADGHCLQSRTSVNVECIYCVCIYCRCGCRVASTSTFTELLCSPLSVPCTNLLMCTGV